MMLKFIRVGDVNNTKILDNGTLKIFNFSIALTPLGQSILTYNCSYVNPTDLIISKVANESCVLNGSLVSWNITVWNNGSIDAFDVIVNDTLPEGFILKNSSSNLIWNIGTLLAGNSISFTIETIAIKVGNWTNIAKVTTSTLETNYTNNEDNDTVQVIKPDIAVEKLSLNKTVYISNQTVFTIIVRNTGDCDLGNVFVVEKIPKGLVYNSFKGINWSYNNSRFIYGGILKVGKSVSFNIVFDTVSPGNWTNVVVAGSNGTGNKTANNTTEVYKPGLNVEKITLNPVVHVGEITSFKIIVTNTGDCKLGNVFVHEDNYKGLKFHSFFGNNWKQKGDNFYYQGILNLGESASFIVSFTTLTPGNFTNIVTAGSNVTANKTAENKTEVIKENPHNPNNKTIIIKENHTKTDNGHDIKVHTSRATGNPLFALFLVLLMISMTSVRKFKK